MKVIPVILLSFLTLPVFAATPFVRVAVGVEQSGDATLVDRDCTNTNPPALFGCGAGVDGRSLAARGDFGTVHPLEIAAGAAFGRARVELAFAHRDLDFGAVANFTGVRGAQPVDADGKSRALMLNGYWTLCDHDDVQPFVFAGAGVARNELDRVHYAFPSIDANAATITRGGRHTGIAWNAGAGVALRLSERMFVDVALRYTRLGDIETEAGEATIIRPTRTLILNIDGTRGDVDAVGVVFGIRF